MCQNAERSSANHNHGLDHYIAVFNPCWYIQTLLTNSLLEKLLVTSVIQMYTNTRKAQTGAVLTPADGTDRQKDCVFQDSADLSGQETKRSVSGSDSLHI